MAPERLRALGLAFRAYIMAGTAAAGSLAAGLAEQLAQDYRVYVDPAAVLPCGDSAEAAPAAGSSRASMCATSEPAEVQQPALRASSLVGVSAAVVCVAAAGMLTHEAHVAELQQACSSACQLVLACPAELTIDQLFHPSGTDSSGSSPSLPDDALDYLQRAWTQRIQISSTHMRASVTGTIPAEPEAVAAAVSSRLGLPDAVLALLPDDIQRKLSKAEVKAGRHLDLAHLNRAGIGQLRMDLSGLAADVAQRVAEALCAMLGGNTSIKTLQLKGARRDHSACLLVLLHCPGVRRLLCRKDVYPCVCACECACDSTGDEELLLHAMQGSQPQQHPSLPRPSPGAAPQWACAPSTCPCQWARCWAGLALP